MAENPSPIESGKTEKTGPRRRRFSLPLGAVLVTGFGGLILIAVGLVLVFGLASATRSTEELFRIRVESILNELVGSLDAQLKPIYERGEWIAAQVEAGHLDPSNETAWSAFAEGILAGRLRRGGGFALVSPDGTTTVFRVRDGRVRGETFSGPGILEQIDDLVARNEATKGSRWSDPVLGHSGRQVVITLVTPLHRDGQSLGTLIQGVTVIALSERLKTAGGGVGVTPFVLYGGTRVLAHPTFAQLPSDRSSPSPDTAGSGGVAGFSAKGSHLPGLAEVGDPILAGIWGPDQFEPRLMRDLSGSQARGVYINGEPQLFVFREISSFGDRSWIVGAHFDVELARAEVMRLVLQAASGLAILVIAIVAAILLSRRTVRPVRLLAEAAQKVESGDLKGVPVLAPSGLRELDEATGAFNRMVQGLRERNLIRDLFGRYVPEAVAANLIKDKGGMRPQSAVATVLFADLAGFTTMSEALEPPEIVEVLNSFFSAMVEIIENRGGVVTQFQGDAILAIFNVPVADPDHAQQAVQAAIEMRRVTDSQTFAGQRLSCRIGINTGPLVAGSVGASGRLSYTVHGDAVNLAARLEQLNKEYGTRILISESTEALVRDIPLRPIGEVTVRGKTEAIVLYSVGDGGD